MGEASTVEEPGRGDHVGSIEYSLPNHRMSGRNQPAVRWSVSGRHPHRVKDDEWKVSPAGWRLLETDIAGECIDW
jgi:hypothetical protein